MGRHLATFSFSHRFFTEIYQPGRLEFQKKGLTAFWLGDVLFSLEYKDLLHVEITGRFPHWVKIVGTDSFLYVPAGSYKALCREVEARGIPIKKVRRFRD